MTRETWTEIDDLYETRDQAQHWEKCTEELRAEVERLQHDWAVACKDLGDARAEVERLKAILKAIERHTAPSTRTWDTCLRDMSLANDLARAALEPKP